MLRALSGDAQPVANSQTLRMPDRSVQKEWPVLVGVLPSQGWTGSTRKSVSDLLRISGTCCIQREWRRVQRAGWEAQVCERGRMSHTGRQPGWGS